MAATVSTEAYGNLTAVGGTDGILTIANTVPFNWPGATGTIARIDGSSPATFAIIEAVSATKLRVNLVLPGDPPPGAQSNLTTYGIGSSIHIESQVLTTGVSATMMADWDLALCRYFLLDGTNGNDENVGYIDAVAGSTLDPTGKPKKTFAGLMAIVPRQGAGRTAAILLVNTNYTSGTTYGIFDFSGITGYRYLRKSGSSDGTNTTVDRIMAGAMIAAAGPNTDGSWTCAGGGTTTDFSVVAGTLPAEISSGGITGWRIRFTGNVNTALLNRTAFIRRNTSTALQPGTNLASAPLVGDTFFIEKPGVKTPSYIECGGGVAVSQYFASFTSPLVGTVSSGIDITGTTVNDCQLGNPYTCQYAFMAASGATANLVVVNQGNEAGSIEISSSYRDEAGVSDNVGMGFRFDGCGRLKCNSVSWINYAINRTTNPLVNASFHVEVSSGNFSVGVIRGLRLTSGIGSFRSSGFAVVGVSGSTNNRRPRILDGGLRVRGHVQIWGITHEGTGAIPAIGVGNTGSSTNGSSTANWIKIDDFIDEPGFVSKTSDFALDVSLSSMGGVIACGTIAANTASGTAGEIKIAGLPVTGLANWSTLDLTNVPDSNGTNLIGTAGVRIPVGSCKTMLNSGGVTINVGEIVRPGGSNNTIEKAQADAQPSTEEVCGVAVTTGPAGGYMVVFINAGAPYVLTSGVVNVGRLLYLSATTAGTATGASPAATGTNRKLRLGALLETLAGPAAYVDWRPEITSVAADAAR